ncbi:GNAT family N-acetyltransferase [Ktedonosporobacter rubrisoli]|uniref:GNAT family N-acetyltransferase n=1 Tax=Ktedonosporobacter rubrisoli TaxID=2509675 RepID=A0A4P6K393_KTERU|nr:GNAT family N-acetyltransferase [Ktedonosporobacter rubrisoli]QBD82373.1 GNAT family N-acetyltransferase [Ktedonosporobacter rubrisoli]
MLKVMLPQGMAVRHARMADMESILRVVNASEIALDGKAEEKLEDLLLEWQAPNFDLETEGWVASSSTDEIIGTLAVEHEEHAKIVADMQIHPDYWESPLAEYLLLLGEEKARQHILDAAPDVRVTLSWGVNSRDVALAKVLRQHGYGIERVFLRMGIDLQEPPAVPQLADGLSIRSMEPEMLRAIYEADEEGFKDHWGHMPTSFEEWKYWAVQSEQFDPSLWFLVMDGEQIAGVAICADEKEKGGWVHRLSTRRAWRRRGIGQALLKHAFAEFYRRGINTAYLTVDSESLTGARKLYERAGMHVVREYNRYEKELRAGRELSTQTVLV